MERYVVLVIGQEEYCIGTVKEVLGRNQQRELVQAIQGAVEEMVFDDDSSDYTVISIEVR